MLFAYSNKIVTKSVSMDGTELEERSVEVMEEKEEGDETKRSSAEVFHWYDNYFIVHGQQKIKNKKLVSGKSRWQFKVKN